MRHLTDRLVVAFDASCVSAAVASRGLGGRRLKSLARAPLTAGALVPSAIERNLLRPDEVREALTRVTRDVEGAGGRAFLVLPDGLARTVLLTPPEGVPPREYARFRIGATLPFPEDEALVDVLAAGGGRVLAAAVRRAVVEEYEAAAAAAGLGQARLELAPLAAVAARLRSGFGPAVEVDVILGETAMSLAVFRDGALRAFRTRLRDPGGDEAQRVAQEVERTATLAGNGSTPRLNLVGHGAPGLARDLVRDGRAAEVRPPWDGEGLPAEAAELSWLGVALG